MRVRLATFGLILTILSMLTAPIGAMAAAEQSRALATGEFTDVPADHPNYTAITWLAQRGFIKGYGDGTFGPNDKVARAQVAGLITRPLGWQFEQWSNSFTDQGTVDNELWQNVGTLDHYEVARGFGDGTFRPADNVIKAQMISFIARAMEKKGYWQPTGDNTALYPEVPADSGHRADLAEYRSYVGGLYGATDGSFADWDGEASRAWVAQVLYDALKVMPAISVPVSGTGNFSGRMNILNFVTAPNGGINAIVNIVDSTGKIAAANETVPVDIAATQAANPAPPPPDTTGAGAQATCDVLNLVLGPLDLNLLGLRVQLNQVVLNITAVTGALVGDLLCGVLNLLNPLGALTDLLAALNNLAAELNNLLAFLPFSGPTAVSGTMLLDNFSQQGEQILANGTLGGQAVSAPIISGGVPTGAGAQATCNVLNLDLGPLDLNLLGLQINLNQVILDITAVTGASNLVGNLLCAIAGLLNPIGPLGQLLDLLNNLLRAR